MTHPSFLMFCPATELVDLVPSTSRHHCLPHPHGLSTQSTVKTFTYPPLSLLCPSILFSLHNTSPPPPPSPHPPTQHHLQLIPLPHTSLSSLPLSVSLPLLPTLHKPSTLFSPSLFLTTTLSFFRLPNPLPSHHSPSSPSFLLFLFSLLHPPSLLHSSSSPTSVSFLPSSLLQSPSLLLSSSSPYYRLLPSYVLHPPSLLSSS